MATRNTIKGVGEKEQTNIMAWVSSKCKKRSYVTLHSLCICRLMLAWISNKISTKLLGMPTHFDWSSLIAVGLYLMRLVSQMALCSRHRCQLPTAISEFLLPTPWLAFPCLLLVASRSRAQAFVWFHAKTDKEIVCLADHLHSVTEKRYHDSREIVKLINSDPAVLDALVTCNESWIYCYDPEIKRQSSQWKHAGSPRPKKAR